MVEAAGFSVELGSARRNETSVIEDMYFTKFQGITISAKGPGRKGPNQVIWSTAQNASKKDGIPPRITTALLLKRGPGQFKCVFEITAKVDRRQEIREKFDKLVGFTEADDPVIFDPTLPPRGVPEGIIIHDDDPVNLGLYTAETELQALALIEMEAPYRIVQVA